MPPNLNDHPSYSKKNFFVKYFLAKFVITEKDK